MKKSLRVVSVLPIWPLSSGNLGFKTCLLDTNHQAPSITDSQSVIYHFLSLNSSSSIFLSVLPWCPHLELTLLEFLVFWPQAKWVVSSISEHRPLLWWPATLSLPTTVEISCVPQMIAHPVLEM